MRDIYGVFKITSDTASSIDVSDNLNYHTNNVSDCNANDWKKVVSSSSSNCRTVSKLDVDNPLIGALDNSSLLTLSTYIQNNHNNDDIYYCCYMDLENHYT